MKVLIIIVLCMTFCSCVDNNLPLPIPEWSENVDKLKNAVPIPEVLLHKLEGVYRVEQGKGLFGDQVVLRQFAHKITLACQTGTYFVFESGFVDSLAIFQGYWRFDLGTQTGLAELKVKKDFNAQTGDTSLVLSGSYYGNKGINGTPFELKFIRKFKDTSNTFLILDHHGGRNEYGLPYSENSLGIIPIAEEIGANGIELDVRLTKDNVPILFHDDNLSTNLVNGEFAIGPVNNYTLAQLRALCTLKDGSPIPTLQEAFDVILSKTSYQSLWLDIKTPETVSYVLPLQIAFLKQAKLSGRAIECWVGLTSDEHITNYLADSLHTQAPSICELDPPDVERAGSVAWGPRWTEGSLTNEAIQIRTEGKRVIYWTLDKAEFIVPFINHGNLDGILTDHPALVSYNYYSRN